MPEKILREKELYEVVERWASRHFGCFATSVNKGTRYGKVDVVGLRQAPGDYSADTDLICIEVKRGTQPLLNALGQAVGYSVYGNFCYLADYRPVEPFSEFERSLAEQLGVGLIRIKSRRQIQLISTARRCEPVSDLRLQLSYQIGYVQCTVCQTFFPRVDTTGAKQAKSLLQRDLDSRARVIRGIADGKGLVYWPEDAADQDKTHSKRHADGLIYNRRFLCNTCATLLLSSE